MDVSSIILIGSLDNLKLIIVIHKSAVLAILQNEPEKDIFIRAISDDPVCLSTISCNRRAAFIKGEYFSKTDIRQY